MTERYKTVIIIRKDLELPPGKLAAQVAHAVMRTNLSFSSTIKNLPDYSYNPDCLPICIVCYVKNEAKFLNLEEKIKKSGLPYSVQIDAGYNFVPENTPTVLCVGPALETKINPLTKRLQIYK